MFQIFDCTGRAVGRPEGYKKHATAQRLAERRGRIKTAIWTAYNSQPLPANPERTRLVYRIEWVDSPGPLNWTGQPLRTPVPGLIPLNGGAIC